MRILNKPVTADNIVALAKALHPDSYAHVYDRGVLIDDGFAGLVFYREYDAWRVIRSGSPRNTPISNMDEVRGLIHELANTYVDQSKARQRAAAEHVIVLQNMEVAQAALVVLHRTESASGEIKL